MVSEYAIHVCIQEYIRDKSVQLCMPTINDILQK